jgi:hypothetical protein
MPYVFNENSLVPVFVDDTVNRTPEPAPRYRDKGRLGADGLLMHTTLDQTNRPIFEYELPKGSTKRSTWMAAHCQQPMLMIRLNNAERSPADAAEIIEAWHRRNPHGVL